MVTGYSVTFFMKKKFLTLLILLCGAVTAIGLLFLLATKIGVPKNGFERRIIVQALTKRDSIALPGVWYYAGRAGTKLFLGKRGESRIIQLDEQNKVSEVALNVPNKKFKIHIDSPTIFFEQYGYDRMYVGEFPANKITDTLSTGLPLIDVEPLSKTSLAALTFMSPDEAFVLGKKTVYGVSYFSGLLKKQVDGQFCTDGMLKYNKEHSRLFYVYYYRNEFLCLDTSMNLQYVAHTIDTTSRAKITVSNIHSEHAATLSSPARVVNNKVHTSGDLLFVYSNLEADNELRSVFLSNMAIDAYTIRDGQYAFSFYIPMPERQKAVEFFVVDKLLYVLFRDRIITYDITINLAYP